MSKLVEETEKYVSAIFKEHITDGFVYHGLDHTELVVKACIQLANEVELSTDESETLILAAWLHDIGFNKGAEGHEARSEELAKAFFAKSMVSPEKVQEICLCIQGTKMPQSPKTKLAMLLCDADLSALGSTNYFEQSKKLLEEWKNIHGRSKTPREWLKMEIEFTSNHSYFTDAANKLYGKQKQKNIAKLKKMLEDLPENISFEPKDTSASKPKKKKKKKKKEVGYSRGVETMFRAAARTHINLSSMADSKSNIMLSINAMILSVTLTVLLPKLDNNGQFLIPSVVLLLTCLGSMILATLATRPSISKGKSTKETIINKRSNLLFFGNFYNMELDEYEWGMKEMMKDNDFLYGSLTRDLYFLGKVLDKKYRYLRICYNVFMYGMILSVIAFAAALAFNSGSASLGNILN